jgi:hypothetical protein
MTALRAGIAGLSIAGLLTAGALTTGRDRTADHSQQPAFTVAHADTGALTAAARTAIAGAARRFAVTVSDYPPAHTGSAGSGSRAGLVTATFERELAATPPAVTPAETRATGRLSGVSVTIRPGPPVTALVLGTVTITPPGQLPVETPVTWVLNLSDTARGWRVAGVSP